MDIDESMFGHKRKYNRGRISKGTWVFSMVKEEVAGLLPFEYLTVQEKPRVIGLVQNFIEPGTLIISDKFSPFFNLNNSGHVHLMVNHSENFVDPYTGAHKNTIEGVWSQ